VIPGELQVWRVWLDQADAGHFPAPTPDEATRAERFLSSETASRYLHAHAALRAILEQIAGLPLEFGLAASGKPYLLQAPGVRFNLARSDSLALVAVALEVEVGIDVEKLRPLPGREEIARHFFPAREFAAFAEVPDAARERAFFRRWTRMEAVVKARGVGLYGAADELEGPWTIAEIDVGPHFAAAVAAPRAGLTVHVHDFGADA